jgi:extradiol dioxygenase family protein
MTDRPPFHLAIPVDDLNTALSFYRDTLGCGIGRTSERWIDFDFFGHQLTVHVVSGKNEISANPVDGHKVPVRHFGVVLDMDAWNDLRRKLEDSDLEFLIKPYTRFQGKVGEQATLFVVDPAGNALEFKAFSDLDQLFASK